MCMDVYISHELAQSRNGITEIKILPDGSRRNIAFQILHCNIMIFNFIHPQVFPLGTRIQCCNLRNRNYK